MKTGGRSKRPRRHRSRRPWLRPLVASAVVLLGLVLAVTAVAVLHALSMEKRVAGLPAEIHAAVDAARNGQLQTAQLELAEAETTLTSVNSSLYDSPDLVFAHVLPVARQNIDAIRSAVALAIQMVGDGRQILTAASPLETGGSHLDVSLHDGTVPVATTTAVTAVLGQAIASLPAGADPPSSRLLLGKVKSLQSRLYQEADLRRQELGNVDAAIRLLDDIAGDNGDRRYLIAVANSAEMRGSGGMILSYGVLVSHAGKLTLQHFGPIDELALRSPETTASFPADFAKSFEYLRPTEQWRNANLLPDFTVDGPVLEAMYTKATGLPVDGVIQVDPTGLGALLSGTGPVSTADLGQVTATNVVPLTLNQAYYLVAQRSARQDYTGEVAKAAFTALTTRSFSSLRPLATALVQAAADRHVLMYTTDPQDEELIRQLGFDGALPPPTASVAQLTVQNFGGNKLDYYLQSSLAITGERLSPLGSRVTATIVLDNTAPPGQTSPTEVFGPSVAAYRAGEYVGLVTLYLPEHSFVRSSRTDASVTSAPVLGTEDDLAAVTYSVAIPAGGSSRVVLDVQVPPFPPGSAEFTFVPAPRVIPTRYTQHLS